MLRWRASHSGPVKSFESRGLNGSCMTDCIFGGELPWYCPYGLCEVARWHMLNEMGRYKRGGGGGEVATAPNAGAGDLSHRISSSARRSSCCCCKLRSRLGPS